MIENSINYYDRDNKLTKTETFGNIKELVITPSKNIIYGNEPVTLSISGKYKDGTAISQEELKDTKWTTTNPNFKLSSLTGQVVTGQLDLNYIKEKRAQVDSGFIEIVGEKNGVKTKFSIKHVISAGDSNIEYITIEVDKTLVVDKEVVTFKVKGKYKDGRDISKEDLSKVTWVSERAEAFNISAATGEIVTGKLNQPYFEKLFNTDFNGSVKITAKLNGIETDITIGYKSTVLENKNVRLTVTCDKLFLKDQESASLTVTGTYKNGTPVPDNILEKVKWIEKFYSLYTYSSEPRGKSIIIINCDAENGNVPMAFPSI